MLLLPWNRAVARLARRSMRLWLATLALALPSSPSAAQAPPARDGAISLGPETPLALHNARALWVDYRGRRAMRLAPLEGHERDSDQELEAVLVGSDFHDGVIEVDVSGARRAGYATDNASAYKGFVGITFRLHGDSAERFYIRPENARLDDQLFRNRSIQYESMPDYPWPRLRKESPDMYEAYADMEAGGWTRLRIEVAGKTCSPLHQRSIRAGAGRQRPEAGRQSWGDRAVGTHQFRRLLLGPAPHDGAPEERAGSDQATQRASDDHPGAERTRRNR